MREVVTKEDLVGVWQLLSCQGFSGADSRFYPYGESPLGKLIYTLDGHMSVILMNPARPTFRSDDISQASMEEISAAFVGFDAYSGTWRLDQRAGRVEHSIEAGKIPNWVGGRHSREASLENGLLTLVTDPFEMAGHVWRVSVVWERARVRDDTSRALSQ